MNPSQSRRQFVQQGTAALSGICGIDGGSGLPLGMAATPRSKNVIFGDVRRIFTSTGKRTYNAFTSMAYWRERYWVVFTQKTKHIANPPDGRIMLILSEDLRTWSDPILLPDAIGDDRDAKILATPDRLVVYNTPYPHETLVCHSSNGRDWTKPVPAYPRGQQRRGRGTGGAQFWKPKWHAGAYYVACDYTNDRVDLLKSNDGIQWKYHATMMSGGQHPRTKRPTETAIVFLKDGSCLGLTRLNDLEGGNCIAGFSLARPPYDKWEFTLGNAVRFGGPAVERFGDTIVVAARAEMGNQPGFLNLPLDYGWNGMRAVRYTLNLSTMRLQLQAVLPSEHRRDNSYFGMVRETDTSGVISWYDGNTTDKSDIWLARIGIV